MLRSERRAWHAARRLILAIQRRSYVREGDGARTYFAHMTAEPEKQGPVVSTSTSSARKTVKKNVEAINQQASRFRMDTVFPGVPSLKPLSELVPPKAEVTTLENGLRVVTQETYGPLTTFGVVMEAGSRDELPGEEGVTHLHDVMAFKSTTTRDHEQLVHNLDHLGAVPFTNPSREQMLMSLDVLRHSLPDAMEIFADILLNPTFDPAEVEEAKGVMELQLDTIAPQMLIRDALQEAAFSGQAVGRPHFCSKEAIPGLSVDKLRAFRSRHMGARAMVLGAAGVEHKQFVELARKHLGRLAPGEGPPKRQKAEYVGGEKRIELPEPTPDGLIRCAVGFEGVGWHDPDLVPMCVAQLLLGGGDSFSAGGPGKGMYSRLYLEVINRFYWVENAEAFVGLFSETGVMGIAGACTVDRSGELLKQFIHHIGRLALQPVNQEELERARNMLKCSLLTQLESRIVLFEDLARQMSTYGFRETPEELCKKIDAVTPEDIMRVGRRAVSKPLSIATVGHDLRGAPTYDTIASLFR